VTRNKISSRTFFQPCCKDLIQKIVQDLTNNDFSRFDTKMISHEFMIWYQGWEVQWISITQTLHLEPNFYFFGGQTLNLKPDKFFLEVRTLNLEPINFFLNGRTLNLGPFAAKTCEPWDLEPQTLNLNMRDFPDLPLAMNINDCRAKWIDWVLISVTCELEKERLELKLLRFKGRCIFAHFQWTLNLNLTKIFLPCQTSNLDLQKVFLACRTLNLKPFAT
jgi:hypothetical protein